MCKVFKAFGFAEEFMGREKVGGALYPLLSFKRGLLSMGPSYSGGMNGAQEAALGAQSKCCLLVF